MSQCSVPMRVKGRGGQTYQEGKEERGKKGSCRVVPAYSVYLRVRNMRKVDTPAWARLAIPEDSK